MALETGAESVLALHARPANYLRNCLLVYDHPDLRGTNQIQRMVMGPATA
jgi:hypothetical protein